MASLSTSEILYLSKKLSPLIWVLRSPCNNVRDNKAYDYWTGFSVGKAVVMSTVSGYNRNKAGITARRIDMKGFSKATPVFICEAWDIMVLKVSVKNDEDDCNIGVFASDGSVTDGELLFSITNHYELVRSLLVGRASYRCVNDVALPPYDVSECFKHSFTPETTTPVYRQMGHIWTNANFYRFGMRVEAGVKKWDQIKLRYKKFHPSIPIIQCHGFQFHPSSSGAPVFNSRGEIVGMLNSNVDVVDIAIHVTLLKVALQDDKVKRILASSK